MSGWAATVDYGRQEIGHLACAGKSARGSMTLIPEEGQAGHEGARPPRTLPLAARESMSTTNNGPATGEGWNPLAARSAAQTRDFLDGIAALARGEGGDETVPLLLLEVSQILLAGAQLGASKDVILPDNWEPDVGADPDLDSLRSGLARRLADYDEY